MNIVNNYSSTMITIMQSVVRDYERNLEIIKQTEEELTDLNHEAELGEARDMYRGWQLYRSIREVRIRRRAAKEENELLKEMYDFFKSQQGQAFKTKIQQIQGGAAKLREIQEHRVYTPRQRSDLTCTEQTSTAHKPFQEMLAEFNKTKVTTKNGKLRK